uniref:SbcC/MukB-like Walker B domain-containing protein n=1 Tax=Treponema sp. TaxID=166 RepID=UPI00388F26CE
HPSPARKSENAPSQETVNSSEKKWKTAQQKTSESAELCAVLTGNLTSIEKEINALSEKLNLHSDISSAKNENRIKFNELIQKQKEINLKITEKQRLNSLLPEIIKESEELKSELNSIESRKVHNLTLIESLKKQIDEKAQKLSFKNRDELIAQGKEIRSKIDFLKNAKESSEQRFNESNSKVSELSGSIKQLENLLKNAPFIDWESENQKKIEVETKKSDNFQKIKEITARIATNSKNLSELLVSQKKLSELDEKYITVNSLSETANGQLTGQGRLMLETYVQMTYFDKILSRANHRFLIMSDGQYELVRRQELAKTGQSGLEIDVIDHYKGGRRDVASLSGGESFMASLSLALGLSDEIQESAGGIKLDALFVDEGFGTLDENTLQLAMKALYSISENNRLVGIISHVAELKEKIDRQIIVTKTQSAGSEVELKV